MIISSSVIVIHCRVMSEADVMSIPVAAKRLMTWSLIDLGGEVGTFINGINVQSNIPHILHCGDMIGMGCPEDSSSRETGKETFVFRLDSPQICRGIS